MKRSADGVEGDQAGVLMLGVLDMSGLFSRLFEGGVGGVGSVTNVRDALERLARGLGVGRILHRGARCLVCLLLVRV